jgi:hypothetical protein
MSGAAEWFRQAAMRQRVASAREYAHDLWLLASVAYGFGSIPPRDTERRLWAAADEASRLTMEYRASL